MRGPSAAGISQSAMAFKRDLLKNLLRGLRARAEACSFDAMSIQERKCAVKRSADEAMAAARDAAAGGGRARWPKAILAAAASSGIPGTCKARRGRCKRVVRRCAGARRMRRGFCAAAGSSAVAAATSSDVARRLVRRRTMALRKVIPGGDAAMDEAALLREAMDYVVHLRAQVDVLRRVSADVQRSAFHRDPAQSMGES
ncbi:unnamed protein product [Urochloa decumbens]|uniref:IBH1-like N-terminal domain-containing protein n=1 Tax=Urochloa decumbens TaxID=240449 RepID=A0ABC9GZK1_9POAL